MFQLYYGGDIITMENEEDNPEAVVVNNGKIIFVGSFEDAKGLCEKEKNGYEKINLSGMTLMPSFIDAHGHISMVAQFSSFCNLSECRNFQDIIKSLSEYKEKNDIKEDSVIIGYGYDHNFLDEQKHPDKEILNQVSETIPMYILHVSSHMGVANSALLALAGISKDTKDPQGGLFGRDEQGNPNGYVEESPAMAMVITKAFSRVKTDYIKQMQDAERLYLRYGITTAQDGASGCEILQGLTAFARENLFKIDVVAYVMTDDYEKAIQKYPEYCNEYMNHFRIGGAKIVLDGSPQGKSAWLSKPYEGEKEYRGYPTHTTQEVLAAAKDAVNKGYQLLAHCNGDSASEQFIECYERALRECERDGAQELRPVMIHCQTVRDDQLVKMKALNMIPSIFVAHTYYWGDIHIKNLGQERASHISPAKTALECGLKYNFHQDAPVVTPDMMHTVWCAVNRHTRTGCLIGKEQCIDVYDALKGITINSAYEYHEEAQKGSIKTGKLADMVILNQNPLKIDKMKLADVKVIKTIKEGKVVFDGLNDICTNDGGRDED